ncbi:hypothetical protein FRUB_01306 [Fimbriiglobus ruber]|uniref:Uncharacterized protein n=1 Tax=Fimbriiglobus ruber TaxID=1908690 RepID=A0A225E8N0_9BACT|nr:hypothetical protein FRUB_01306 [Fimbriiglobus ruber]
MGRADGKKTGGWGMPPHRAKGKGADERYARLPQNDSVTD